MDIRVTRGSAVERIMRHPLLHTDDRARAERSRLTYGPASRGGYATSLLGILNGLVGLRLDIRDQPSRSSDAC